ncbi:MAG: hypothetical protein CM1200mP26_15320 [Acidimicrobiales bacterium]|nr:MAG: hypothetical protein CM1200mP26_15320 [Acidimicrobiales bacterium]
MHGCVIPPFWRRSPPAALDGERLDRVVALLADVSRNRAGGAIDPGAVYVDGPVATVRSRKVGARARSWLSRGLGNVGSPGPRWQRLGLPCRSSTRTTRSLSWTTRARGWWSTPVLAIGVARWSMDCWPGIPRWPVSVWGPAPGIVPPPGLGHLGGACCGRTQRAYDSLVAQLAERTVGGAVPSVGLGST